MSDMIYRFGDIFYIIDGDRGVNYPKEKDFSDDGYCLFLNAGNVTKNGWSFNKVSFITKEKDSQLRKGRIERGDTVFTTRGTIGNAAYYGNSIKYDHMRINSGMVILKAKDNQIINDEFIYYLVTSPLAKKTIELFCSGSAQPQLPIKDFIKIKYDLPSLKTQKKIAFIIGSYDNLIENNNRRIRLLEQMAENLYKEWFAYHNIVESSKEIRLTDIVSIYRGLSYSSEEIECEEGNDLINLKNIQAFGGFRLDGTKKYNGKYKAEQVVKEGDLVMGVTDMTQDRRTVGSVALIPNISNLSVISADLIKLESTIDNVFLYAMFRWGNVSKYISQFANGANVLHLRPQILKNIKVLLPKKELIDQYVSTVKPMIETINKLNTETANLTRQRDLLLPRLMSGKLEVNA